MTNEERAALNAERYPKLSAEERTALDVAFDACRTEAEQAYEDALLFGLQDNDRRDEALAILRGERPEKVSAMAEEILRSAEAHRARERQRRIAEARARSPLWNAWRAARGHVQQARRRARELVRRVTLAARVLRDGEP